MKNVIKTAIIFFCLFLFAACNSSSSEEDRAVTEQMLTSPEKANIGQQEDSMMMEQMEEESNGSEQVVNTVSNERKVMYTAHMEIVVANYTETEGKVTELVQKENGYVVSSNVHRDDAENKRGHFTIKIPQEKFESFLKSIDDLSVEVTEQNVQGEDVTEEFVDLNARLKAKKDVKEKLETFLKDATATKDLLDISEQIGKVQEEIEQIEGRLNYLKNQTDYSTVTISMTERKLNVGEIGSKDQNTWVRAKQLLVSTMNAILSFVSGTIVIIIGLSPIVFPVLTIVIGIFIYRKRKKKKEASRE